MVTYRKVGGLHFVRIMSLHVSWCVTGRPPYARRSASMIACHRGRDAALRAIWIRGWDFAA